MMARDEPAGGGVVEECHSAGWPHEPEVPSMSDATPSPRSHDPRATRRAIGRGRRKVLGLGALALAAVGAVGAIEGIPRAERDLERRTEARLGARGITGVDASFSGQDGTLHCAAPLTDPARAVRLTEQLWGVRVAELDPSCVASTAVTTAAPVTTSATVTTAAPDTTAPVTTVAPTTTAPVTTVAPATTAAPTTTAATTRGDVVATFADGRLVLTGTVADDAARAALIDAAVDAGIDPANIDDQLVLAGASGAAADGAGAADLAGLARLVATMPAGLVSGTATLAGDGSLRIEGTYADDAGRDVVQEAADATGADAALTEREEATASQAAQLTDELNEFVAANPILFQPNSAVLTPAASAVVDQVAAIANRYGGVAIEVIGHTDTDGDANRNLVLSEQRAAAVLDALEARGVTAALTSTGLGETEPVIVGGAEDKAASRRVVFEITAV